jgi:uncharacterized tellurite resistance protein B-like protein
MIGEIKAWFAGGPDRSDEEHPGSGEERSGGLVRLAAAALLVEAAFVDDSYNAAEQATIRRLLERRFDLTEAAARELLADAVRTAERSAQLFRFTQRINERLSLDQRIALIEMLWEVVFADGELDPLEDTLLRRIGGLIDVPDRERGLARRRVLRRLGREGTDDNDNAAAAGAGAAERRKT